MNSKTILRNTFRLYFILFIGNGAISFASDNIAYLRTGNYLGIINGATTTSLQNNNSYFPGTIALDLNNKPMTVTGDFNGDGRTDIIVIRKFLSFFYAYAYDFCNDTYLLWQIKLNGSGGRFSNLKTLLSINNIGDLNDDGIDDLNLIFDDTNNLNQTTMNVSISAGSLSMVNGPYYLTNINGFGKIIFANVGDFKNSDGKRELVYIYNDTLHTGYQTARTYQFYPSFDSCFNKETGYQGYPLVGPSYGKIQFTTVGDFNGDGTDELVYIFNDTTNSGYQVALTYKVTGTFTQLSTNTTLTESEKIQYHWGYPLVGPYAPMGGAIICINVGDFDGNGVDELNFIFDNVNNIHQTSATYNAISFVKISGPYHLTNKDYMGSIKMFGNGRLATVGDFNGDGKAELFYIFSKSGTGYDSLITIDVATHTVLTQSKPIYDMDNPGSPLSISYCLTVGPVVKYMSRIADKNFIPIPKERSGSEKMFPLGWWSSLGMASDYPTYSGYNDTSHPWGAYQNPKNFYQLVGANLYNQDKGNIIEVGLDANYCLGTTVGPNFIDTAISKLSVISVHKKNSLVQAYRMAFYSTPYTSNGIEYKTYPFIDTSNSTFKDKFINLYSTFNTKISGYYIGDDIKDVIQRRPPYDSASTTYFSTGDLQKLNKFVHDRTNKWTFAGETFNGHRYFYDTAQVNVCDIPVMYEYIFGNGQNTGERNGLMLEITTKFEELRKRVLLNNQPGFIHLPQAHADITRNPDQTFGRRSPTPFESRYDVYNGIIHGAGGIMPWWLNASDTSVIYNFNRIFSQISTDQTKTLYRALCGGKDAAFPVTSSKDGFNKDYDKKYKIGADSLRPGNQLSDINYIVRSESGTTTKYLLTINNSDITVTNTVFYLDPTAGSLSINETARDGANDTAYSYGEYSKKGVTYKTLTVPQYQPFEVKIFRFGSAPSSAFSEDFTSVSNAILKIHNFELSNNYPNPFNPTTTISYALPTAGAVSLKVYDLLGKEVMTLVNNRQVSGRYSVNFDGSKLASGMYIYKLTSGSFTEVKKMMLVK